MITHKNIKLHTQNNSISLSRKNREFGMYIMGKNIYGDDQDSYTDAKMILKNDAQLDFTFFLETMLQLFGRLQSLGGSSISINQKILQQELIRQIKNQINIFNQYQFNGEFRRIFQNFQDTASFSNFEIIEQTIKVLEDEIKKKTMSLYP